MPVTKASDILGGIKALAYVRAWRETAGPVLVSKIEFHGVFRSGANLVLRIDCQDPVWRTELQYQTEELLCLYRKTLLGMGVRLEDQPVSIEMKSAPHSVRGGSKSNGSLPVKPINPQQGRKKERIKR